MAFASVAIAVIPSTPMPFVLTLVAATLLTIVTMMLMLARIVVKYAGLQREPPIAA